MLIDMEPLLKEKRQISLLIPYRWNDGVLEFFLQKRDANAPVHAKIFSMFGGGFEEGEDMLTALKRELQEELEYEARNAEYFCRFETSRSVANVFIEEVPSDFESKVTVHEGEYGKFLPFESIDKSKEVSDIAEMVTRALTQYLKK